MGTREVIINRLEPRSDNRCDAQLIIYLLRSDRNACNPVSRDLLTHDSLVVPVIVAPPLLDRTCPAGGKFMRKRVAYPSWLSRKMIYRCRSLR